jgi:hypothetical protein
LRKRVVVAEPVEHKPVRSVQTSPHLVQHLFVVALAVLDQHQRRLLAAT